jgi:hypothetical protein
MPPFAAAPAAAGPGRIPAHGGGAALSPAITTPAGDGMLVGARSLVP